ncbi:dehydratase [Lithospermum erythrorhizon]|uniref:Carbonic anhydrase n=1 Tax=Lithospermum erythrorhizon TaxID=34254 RepID=A0AAV3S0T2_LITER
MKRATAQTLTLSLLLIIVLLFWITKSIGAQEVEDESEFNYIKGSDKGPHRWGYLKEEWAACKHGKMQSPIDMSHERVRIIQKVEKRSYKPANATISNRGHDIMVQFNGDAGAMFINGNEYLLSQVHWHSTSEHTIHGRRYALELHLVHQCFNQSVKNNVSVVAVLFKIGKPDKFLTELTPTIKTMIDLHEERHLELVDPRRIKINNKRFYRYLGSLTVPPCTEGVIWTISKKIMTVSKDQVMLLREAVHDSAENNARPLQPRNPRRDVHLMVPAKI